MLNDTFSVISKHRDCKYNSNKTFLPKDKDLKSSKMHEPELQRQTWKCNSPTNDRVVHWDL